MCITELQWIGAYTRQGAEIKPNSKALPLSWLSHEAKGYILLIKQPHSQSRGVPDHLGQPGWHTAPQPRCCALSSEHGRLPAAVLPLGWNSTKQKVAGGTGLPWKLKHLIMFEGIFGVVTREKFVSEQPFPHRVTEFIEVSNQVTSEPLEKACPTLRKGRWRHVKADVCG